MRKKVLGTLAALALSAGGALAQYTNPPIPPMLPPGAVQPPAELPVPNGDPNALMPNGQPVYPNGGPYGQTPYDSPALERTGLLGRGGGHGGAGGGGSMLFFDGQYLLMFPKGQPLNFPLLTTSAPADAGIVGRPTTTDLQPNLGLGNASGFRLSAGYFHPTNTRLGGEIGGMYLAPTSNTVFVSSASNSNGVPVIARPFITTNGTGGSILASFPTFAFGSALSRASTQFWGAEANSLINLYRTAEGDSRHWVLNFLAGFRYNQLHETIDVTTRGTLLPGNTAFYNGIAVASPTSVEVRDTFATRNSFYGGQAGLQSQFNSGRWYFGVTGKVGVGIIHQEIDVSGATNALNTATQSTSNSVGGVLANAGNIGTYRNDQFGLVTDLNASLGYQITPWLATTIGYNFIHLNSVARPGNLFNGQVNAAQIPASGNFGGTSTGTPTFNARQDDFFVHGLNFGFIVRY